MLRARIACVLFLLSGVGCSPFEPDVDAKPLTVTNNTGLLLAVRPAIYIDSIPDDPFEQFTITDNDRVLHPDSSLRFDAGNIPGYKRGATISLYLYVVTGGTAVLSRTLRLSYSDLERSKFRVPVNRGTLFVDLAR